MTHEGNVDPPHHGSRPTQEEVAAWAERERRRRAAWAAGPGEDEKREWARRYRWRAAFGLEESRLGPLPEEVEQWAEREHKRREEWLAGPNVAEQRERSRRHQGAAETVEDWAARERRRRQQWLAGPSEDEKAAWAERRPMGPLDDLLRVPDVLQGELPESIQLLLRETELAAKGLVYSLSRGPNALWHYLTRAGKAFEEELHRHPFRRRVPY
jgi:hypothetical protein